MKRISELHPAWIAAFIGTAMVLWVLSGSFGGTDEEHKVAHKSGVESGPVKVQAEVSHATQITREAIVSGRTAPVRSVTVRAETAGQVRKIEAQRGGLVADNAVIVRLSVNDRQAQLRQAKAIRDQRQLQYSAAKKLQAKGYQTAVDLAQAKANMEASRAEVERFEEDIAHTVIRAPFAGVLETRPVEEGDFVSVGDEIARIIDQDSFIVTANVSEDVVGYLQVGQSGTAKLINNKNKQGKLRYIASEADEATRTYRVEMLVANEGDRLIAGSSTELRLPLEQVMAHEVEPAILSLNAQGEFGIKAVDDSDHVRFYKADIVRNNAGKVWLAGLPETLRLITVGQGFVTDGDAVAVKDKEDGEPARQLKPAANAPESRP